MTTLDYSTITHPLTGENIPVHSLNGKTLIRNYLELLTGGGAEEADEELLKFTNAVDAFIDKARNRPTDVDSTTWREQARTLQTAIPSLPEGAHEGYLGERVTKAGKIPELVATALQTIGDDVSTEPARKTAIDALEACLYTIKKQTSPVWICSKTVDATPTAEGGGDESVEMNAVATMTNSEATVHTTDTAPTAEGSGDESAEMNAVVTMTNSEATVHTIDRDLHPQTTLVIETSAATEASSREPVDMVETCEKINTNLKILIGLFKQMMGTVPSEVPTQ
tara:strand:- start:8188 stop:9030 length:843 start_codon:yes stop_codon:yes gene_type:complete